MMKNSIAFLASLLAVCCIFEIGSAQFLGQPCYSNADCSPRYSKCTRLDKTASKGMCICRNGFTSLAANKCVKQKAKPHLKSLPPVSSKTVLGKLCKTNNDCASDPNAICREAPVVCNIRETFCTCPDGYVEDNGLCKRPRSFGMACSQKDFCNDHRTACNATTQKCDCDKGSKPHPLDATQCISATATVDLHGSCRTDSECYDGMECYDDECTCDIGTTYDSSQKKCIPISIGDPCEYDDDCFLNKLSVCSYENDTCSCPDDKTLTVVNIGTKATAVCLPGRSESRQLGQPCNVDENEDGRNFCRPPYICQRCLADGSEKVCAMTDVTPMFPRLETAIKLQKAQLHEFCSDDEDCLATNSECFDSYCECKIGFGQTGNDECIPESDFEETTPRIQWELELGENCDKDFECAAENSYCGRDFLCECRNGFYQLRGECVEEDLGSTTSLPVELGDQCDSDRDCFSSISNSICEVQNGVCKCDTDFVETRAGRCVRSVAEPACHLSRCDLGATCRPGIDTCKTSGAVCVSNLCQCPQGTKPGEKDDCIDVSMTSRLYQTCDNHVECYYNLSCISYRCQCYSGFEAVGNYDCKQRVLGDPCTYDNDCQFIKNSGCVDRMCNCRKGYMALDPKVCGESLWYKDVQAEQYTCQKDVDCRDPRAPANSVCASNKQCICPDNTVMDISDGYQNCKYVAAHDYTGWSCSHHSDCGRDPSFICVMNECVKKGLVASASWQITATAQILTATVVISMLFFFAH